MGELDNISDNDSDDSFNINISKSLDNYFIIKTVHISDITSLSKTAPSNSIYIDKHIITKKCKKKYTNNIKNNIKVDKKTYEYVNNNEDDNLIFNIEL